MATSEELIKLILSVNGGEALEDLQENLRYVQAATEQLKQAYERGDVSLEQFIKTGQSLAASEARLTQVLRDATNATKDNAAATSSLTAAAGNAGAATTDMGKRSGAAARGVLELSRGVEDFTTGGPIGILNNIPGMFQSLGTAAGMSATGIAAATAGVSLFATFAYTVYQNRDKITEAISGITKVAEDKVGELEKKIEELGNKPLRITTDLTDLNAAKDKLDDMQRAANAYKATMRSTAEGDVAKEAAETTQKYLGGAKGLAQEILDKDHNEGVSRGTGADDTIVREGKAEMAKLQAEVDATTGIKRQRRVDELNKVKAKVDPAEARIAKANQDYAEDLAGKFAAGDEGAIKRVKAISQSDPSLFNRVGPGGVTGKDAINNMAGTKEESQKNADTENDIKEEEDKLKEQVTEMKKVKATNKVAKKKRWAASDKELKEGAKEAEDLKKRIAEGEEEAGKNAEEDWKKADHDAKTTMDKSKEANKKNNADNWKTTSDRTTHEMKRKSELASDPRKEWEENAKDYGVNQFMNNGAKLGAAKLMAERAVKLAQEQDLSIQEAVRAIYDDAISTKAQTRNARSPMGDKQAAEFAVNPRKQVEQAATEYAINAFESLRASPMEAQLAAAQAMQLSMEKNLPLQMAIAQTYQNIARMQQLANDRISQMNSTFVGPW